MFSDSATPSPAARDLSPPDILDPAEPTPAWAHWLAVQDAFVFHPVEAAARLAANRDPARLLARAEGQPLLPEEVRRRRRALIRCGAVGLPLVSPAYPRRLARLADAAALLFVRGQPAVLARDAVAIVGARAATPYGVGVARRLAAELAECGLVVVSGLARGIDAAAHQGALAAGGRSVAFQACGPDRVYPAAHRALAAQLCEAGAVATEFPLGTPPRAAHFPLRNRLIAGLARAVIVVEARVRSGSLVTARLALDQGAEVLAVPGPVTSPVSAGPLALLRDGAPPVADADDVLRALGRPPRSEVSPRAPEPGPPGSLERRVWRALREAPASRDALALRFPGETGLAEALLALELARRIAEGRDGRLCAL